MWIYNVTCTGTIAMFLIMSPFVINVPTRGLLAVEILFSGWKRNMTSMFVNKKHRYTCNLAFLQLCHSQQNLSPAGLHHPFHTINK